MPEKEKFYITTSIPYLNAPPHLGFALEAVQADVIARHKRILGQDVFFLSGTDEHGVKIARAAESAGKTAEKFVDDQVKPVLGLLLKLGISNNDFIRTSDQKRHWPGAQLLWKKLKDSGDIYKGFYKGLYCVGHEAFITEKDIENGVCVLHKKPPEVIEEENYFFRISKYTSKIKESIASGDIKILPAFRKNETLQILKDVGDISFSRPSKDIAWGIPVPDDATQTMYVWCDALSNYITALGFGIGIDKEGLFSRYWPADAHIIGKDILKFHTVFWPAMLMSAGLPLPRKIFVHGFINVRGEKMSKSLGNVIDPFPLLEKYGKEAVRFYLAHEISTFGDSDYSDEHFQDVYNGVLVNGLGNLLARTLKMIISVGGSINRPDEAALASFPFKKNIEDLAVGSEIKVEEVSPVFWVDTNLWPLYRTLMEDLDIASSIRTVWAFLRRLDEYIEEYQIYKMIVLKPDKAKIMLWQIAYSLASAAWMLKPFLPDTSDKILAALGIDAHSSKSWTSFSAKEIKHLFPRIK